MRAWEWACARTRARTRVCLRAPTRLGGDVEDHVEDVRHGLADHACANKGRWAIFMILDVSRHIVIFTHVCR